jgi:hypothetical protein
VPKLVEDMSVENLVDWLRQLNVNEEAIKVLQIYHAVVARDRAAGGGGHSFIVCMDVC